MATTPMTPEDYRQAITIARRSLADASALRVNAEVQEAKAQRVLDALLWRRPALDQ